MYSSESDTEEGYEVEEILDDKIEKGIRMYMIKWKGYGPEFNEWLPKSYLHCPVILQDYERLKKKKLQEQKQKKRLEEEEKNRQKEEEMKRMRFGKVDVPPEHLPEIKVGRPCFSPDHRVPKPTRLFTTGTPHQDQWLEMLKRSRYHFLITNEVDDEGPPDSFEWIEEGVMAPGVPNIDLHMTVGCTCDGDCWKDEGCSCLATRGGVSPYDKYGCVRFSPTAMAIYECNLKCACSIYCPNRVTQRIPDLTFNLFKTDNGRGWGVKTTSALRKGQFISRYVGEVITDEEAGSRSNGKYMFDIDFLTEDGCKFVIDSQKMGNISRYFNHSCNPNMATYSVFIDTDDAYRHELALFTTRVVAAGEELTFDYGGFNKTNMVGGGNEKGFSTCFCGAPNCRRILPIPL